MLCLLVLGMIDPTPLRPRRLGATYSVPTRLGPSSRRQHVTVRSLPCHKYTPSAEISSKAPSKSPLLARLRALAATPRRRQGDARSRPGRRSTPGLRPLALGERLRRCARAAQLRQLCGVVLEVLDERRPRAGGAHRTPAVGEAIGEAIREAIRSNWEGNWGGSVGNFGNCGGDFGEAIRGAISETIGRQLGRSGRASAAAEGSGRGCKQRARGPIRESGIEQSEAIRSNQKQSEATRSNQWPYSGERESAGGTRATRPRMRAGRGPSGWRP